MSGFDEEEDYFEYLVATDDKAPGSCLGNVIWFFILIFIMYLCVSGLWESFTTHKDSSSVSSSSSTYTIDIDVVE